MADQPAVKGSSILIFIVVNEKTRQTEDDGETPSIHKYTKEYQTRVNSLLIRLNSILPRKSESKDAFAAAGRQLSTGCLTNAKDSRLLKMITKPKLSNTIITSIDAGYI